MKKIFLSIIMVYYFCSAPSTKENPFQYYFTDFKDKPGRCADRGFLFVGVATFLPGTFLFTTMQHLVKIEIDNSRLCGRFNSFSLHGFCTQTISKSI